MNIRRYIDKRVKNEMKQLRRHVRRDSVNIQGVIREILAKCKEFILVAGRGDLLSGAVIIVGRIMQILNLIGTVHDEIEVVRISKKLAKLNRELEYETRSILFSKNFKEKSNELDNRLAEADKLAAKRAKLISRSIHGLIGILSAEFGIRMMRSVN